MSSTAPTVTPFSQKLGSSSRLDWPMDFHFHVTVFHACSPLCTGSFCCEPLWAEGQVPRFQGRCMSVLRAPPADEGRRWQVPRLQERLSVEALHHCGRVLGDHEQDERHVQGEGRLQEVLRQSDGGVQGGRGQAGCVSLPPAQVSVHEWCSRQSNHPKMKHTWSAPWKRFAGHTVLRNRNSLFRSHRTVVYSYLTNE